MVHWRIIGNGRAEGEGLGFFTLKISPEGLYLCAEGDEVVAFPRDDPFEDISFERYKDMVREHLLSYDDLKVVVTQTHKKKKLKT